MATPTSSLQLKNHIQTEFGGAIPTSLSEYKRGGAYVPSNQTTSATDGVAIPTVNSSIRMGMFRGLTKTATSVPIGYRPTGATTNYPNAYPAYDGGTAAEVTANSYVAWSFSTSQESSIFHSFNGGWSYKTGTLYVNVSWDGYIDNDETGFLSIDWHNGYGWSQLWYSAGGPGTLSSFTSNGWITLSSGTINVPPGNIQVRFQSQATGGSSCALFISDIVFLTTT